MEEKTIDFLKSDRASISFGSKGQVGEASRAIEPILRFFEEEDSAQLPQRISTPFRRQLLTELEQLQRAGLKRVVRITDAKLTSLQGKNGFGFTRWTDASREWRECELEAAVLEQYVDSASGEIVIEKFDAQAKLTLRQSRHIKAADQRKAKEKGEVYVREEYNCPSCGAGLEHVADHTQCPYCGALIIFNFFDWQIDSFYLDLRKASLLDGAKEVAEKGLIGVAWLVSKIVDLLASAGEKKAERSHDPTQKGYNHRLGAGITVAVYVIALLAIGLLALPPLVRILLGAGVVVLIARFVIRFLKDTEQERRKGKIVRFSDAYLRSCVYDEIWRKLDSTNLIDFSVDDIQLKALENSDTTTTIDLSATVIKKYLTQERTIDIRMEEASMKLSRARYPERKKSKGKTMVEKDCPNCGANFEPDNNSCCSYCGYGLKMENYVWRKAN